MRATIYKLYVANFLTGIVFWYAVEKVFMQSIGIDPFLIGVNAVIFLVITVLFDIPSGMLADRWSRKYTLLLALGALVASSIVHGVSTNFILYACGTVVYAGYVVLSWGTFQAMMYDSLAEIHLEKQYSKYQGRAYGLFMIGAALSSAASGYLSNAHGLRALYFWSSIVSIGALIVVATIREPRRYRQTSDTRWRQHIGMSFKLLAIRPPVLQLVVLLVVAGMLRSTQNEFAGLYYIGLGLSVVAMGYVNGAKWLIGALGQFIAARLGRHRSLVLAPLFFVLFAGFTVATGSVSVAMFLSAAMVFYIVTNQAEAALQDETPSELRATTLSVISFLTNISMIPLSLLFGYLAQTYSVFVAYRFFAVVGMVYVVVWFLMSKKVITSGVVTSGA